MGTYKKYQLIYYAHSKLIYNSVNEVLEYEYLKKRFSGFVICPNKHIGELGNIEPYLDIVKKADVLVATEINGWIGKGVYSEIYTALKKGIFVYVLRLNSRKQYILKRINRIGIYDEKDWKLGYGKIID